MARPFSNPQSTHKSPLREFSSRLTTFNERQCIYSGLGSISKFKKKGDTSKHFELLLRQFIIEGGEAAAQPCSQSPNHREPTCLYHRELSRLGGSGRVTISKVIIPAPGQPRKETNTSLTHFLAEVTDARKYGAVFRRHFVFITPSVYCNHLLRLMHLDIKTELRYKISSGIQMHCPFAEKGRGS